MRRALLAFLGLIGLYGCYDYTLPEGDAPKSSPSKKDAGSASSSAVEDASRTPTDGDAPVTPVETTSSDAGSDAADAGQCAVKCANGCVNGTCNPPTKCVAGGAYCGGDKVNGDPNVLYKCGADGFATTVQQACVNGCVVAPAGQDDFCK
jgi:hypothetical protein